MDAREGSCSIQDQADSWVFRNFKHFYLVITLIFTKLNKYKVQGVVTHTPHIRFDLTQWVGNFLFDSGPMHVSLVRCVF